MTKTRSAARQQFCEISQHWMYHQSAPMQMSPGAKLLDAYPSTYLPHSVSQWCFQIRCRIFSAFCFEMAGQFIKVFHSSTGADIKMTLLQLLQRRWWCCCCHDDNWEERTGLGCLDRGGRCLFQLSLGLPNGHTPPIPPISELFGAIRSCSELLGFIFSSSFIL